MGLRRIGTSVAAATSLVAAAGVGYVVGTGSGSDDRPPAAPPIALANADLTTPASCDDLLDSYVDRALEEVGPYGWGGSGPIVMFDAQAGSEASSAHGVGQRCARSRRPRGR